MRNSEGLGFGEFSVMNIDFKLIDSGDYMAMCLLYFIGFALIIFGEDITFVMKSKTTLVRCPITMQDVTREKFWRKWIFFGIVYEPSTKKFSCIINDSKAEVIQLKQMVEAPQTNPNPILPFSVGADNTVFQIDDIVYIPKNQNIEGLSHIFNKSKIISTSF